MHSKRNYIRDCTAPGSDPANCTYGCDDRRPSQAHRAADEERRIRISRSSCCMTRCPGKFQIGIRIPDCWSQYLEFQIYPYFELFCLKCLQSAFLFPHSTAQL